MFFKFNIHKIKLQKMLKLKFWVFKMWVFFIAILFFFSFTGYGYADKLVFCKDVADGDTLFVRTNKRDVTIRLIGVDTPEVKSKFTNEEYFGKEASNYTRRLVKRKKIRLKFDIIKRDKYRRLLAYVYLPDGRMLNELLIKNGYARVYKFFKYKKKKEFISWERSAKLKCIGLWGKYCE